MQTVVHPSVNEVVVPNVFPRFVVAIFIDVVKRDHRADTLDILETGFYIVISTEGWYS